jgi:hypothetical protein
MLPSTLHISRPYCIERWKSTLKRSRLKGLLADLPLIRSRNQKSRMWDVFGTLVQSLRVTPLAAGEDSWPDGLLFSF